MALFDWLKRSDRQASPTVVWNVYREGSEVVAEDGRGGVFRASRDGARSVRIVPLTGGNHHTQRSGSGWQVAIAHASGDVPLGKPMADWRMARELARQLCARAELPLDELTEKMFSRVGQYAPAARNEGIPSARARGHASGEQWDERGNPSGEPYGGAGG